MDKQEIKLVCFELCGEKFAFNMDYLVEIVQVQESTITPVFSSIPFLRGKWHYRDNIIYIIDLREFFGLSNGFGALWQGQLLGKSQEKHAQATQPDGDTHSQDAPLENPSKNILVVNIREHIWGLLTDTVLQVVPLGLFYEYPTMISTLPKRYFSGVTIINAEIVLILSIEELLNPYEIESLRRIEH